MKKLILIAFMAITTSLSSQTSLSVEAGTREFKSADFVVDFHQHVTRKFTVSSWNTYATASNTQTVFSNMMLSLNHLNYRLYDNLTISVGYRFERNITYDYSIWTPVAKIRWKIL